LGLRETGSTPGAASRRRTDHQAMKHLKPKEANDFLPANPQAVLVD
jgi:hypothetical protein